MSQSDQLKDSFFGDLLSQKGIIGGIRVQLST